MEHRLILGGEQFLPFARSRIRALRALGLPYADQSFEIDGVSIKVRIEPGHEYIRLEGGGRMLSGVVRKGELIVVDSAYKYLRAFKPTHDAWASVMGAPSTAPENTFSDSAALAVVIDPAIKNPVDAGKSQYSVIKPTMYSGRMTQLVQLLLGAGSNMKGPGVSVVYDYRWSRTHGVSTASDGSLWLIEISADNGVLAMRLPVGGTGGRGHAASEAKRLFKGTPTGKSFPIGEKLIEAIEKSKVFRLLSADDLLPFYTKSPHSSACGWVLNNAGTEAHNTCWNTALYPGATESTCNWAYHYKISIAIDRLDGPDPITGKYTLVASASLVQVDASVFIVPPDIYPTMMFYEPEVEGVVAANATKPSGSGYVEALYTPFPSDATLYVMFVNDTLRRVRYRWTPGTAPSGYFGPLFEDSFPNVNPPKQWSNRTAGRFCASVYLEEEGVGQEAVGILATVHSVTNGAIAVNLAWGGGAGILKNRYYGQPTTSVEDQTWLLSYITGFSSVKGDRNACVLCKRWKTSYEVVGSVNSVYTFKMDPRFISSTSTGVRDGGGTLIGSNVAFSGPTFGTNPVVTLPTDIVWTLPDNYFFSPGSSPTPEFSFSSPAYDDALLPPLFQKPLGDVVYPTGRNFTKEVAYLSDGSTVESVADGEAAAVAKLTEWDDLWSLARTTGHADGAAFVGTRSVLGEVHRVGNVTLGGAVTHTGALMNSEPAELVDDYTFIGAT